MSNLKLNVFSIDNYYYNKFIELKKKGLKNIKINFSKNSNLIIKLEDFNNL